ncbi:uncharacterized protein LOC108858502 [Raphanus sativus]|uniref:Uncharacterized protein LOC108858502 n=1 Tax=Raphanus sativus TaxID=3726 RepID=A0A9W3BR09_RAPSA|nr:uncharacterized protein LOC108858502 [Raphanus sativus]
MDISEDLTRDYPPRLYPEGKSILENKLINTNSRFGDIHKLREGIGSDVWDNLKTYRVGLIARLFESKMVWLSLIEFGEFTGLNTNPLPEESFEPDPENYKALWELLNVPLGYGPKLDELTKALTSCRMWSADQRKCCCNHKEGRTPLSGFKDVLMVWAYESVTVFRELYGRLESPGEIPLLRWGGSRTRAAIATTIAKEISVHGTVRVRKMVMKEGLEELFPQWVDEADDPQLDNLIKDIHEDRFVRDFYVQSNENNKQTKAVVSSEAEPPSKKQKKEKKQKEVKINEVETVVVEVKESAEEKDRREAVLLNLVAQIASMDQKFDSRLTEYDTKLGDFSRGILDTIGDTVKSTVEDRLRVLGVVESAQNVTVSEENRQPEPSSGQTASPVKVNQSQKTPDKGYSDKNLADYIAKADAKGMRAKLNSKLVRDEAGGVKKHLNYAFGNADATKADLVSGSPGKEPPFGRGCRGKRKNLAADSESDEAELRKKQKQEEAELRRKKKQEEVEERKNKREEAELQKKLKKEEAELQKKLKKEEVELKKKKKQEESDLNKDISGSKGSRSGTIRITIPTRQSEAKTDELLPESDVEEDERKRCGRIKEYRLKAVQLSPDGSQRSAEFGPPVPFPHIGDNVTTCMRKGISPSPAIYDPLGPVDPVKRENLLQHLKPHEEIRHGGADEEIEFYRILITPRPWPKDKYGWLDQCHIAAYIRILIQRSKQDPSPFWSNRIAFVDSWFLGLWVHDYTSSEGKMEWSPSKFRGTGYKKLVNGLIPSDIQTKLQWFTDVDHLYGVLNTGGDHWVGFHVDLHKQKIDCYDSVVGQNELRGECGVYALKLVECLALGVAFDGISDENIQGLRMKMAADVFDEGTNILAGAFGDD